MTIGALLASVASATRVTERQPPQPDDGVKDDGVKGALHGAPKPVTREEAFALAAALAGAPYALPSPASLSQPPHNDAALTLCSIPGTKVNKDEHLRTLQDEYYLRYTQTLLPSVGRPPTGAVGKTADAVAPGQ